MKVGSKSADEQQQDKAAAIRYAMQQTARAARGDIVLFGEAASAGSDVTLLAQGQLASLASLSDRHFGVGRAESKFRSGDGLIAALSPRPEVPAAADGRHLSFSQRFRHMADTFATNVVVPGADFVLGTAQAATSLEATTRNDGLTTSKVKKSEKPSLLPSGKVKSPPACLEKISKVCGLVFDAHLWECTLRDPCPHVSNPICDSRALLEECNLVDHEGHMKQSTRIYYRVLFEEDFHIPFSPPNPWWSPEKNIKHNVLLRLQDNYVDFLEERLGKEDARKCVQPLLRKLANIPNLNTGSTCKADINALYKQLVERGIGFDELEGPTPQMSSKSKELIRWILTSEEK